MYLVRIDREERKSELCNLLGIPTNAEFIQQINDYPRQYIATFTTRDKTVDVCHKLRQAYIGREATNYDTKIVINLNNPEQTKLMKEICDYGEFSQTTI
jgi:hypothetical protein